MKRPIRRPSAISEAWTPTRPAICAGAAPDRRASSRRSMTRSKSGACAGTPCRNSPPPEPGLRLPIRDRLVSLARSACLEKALEASTPVAQTIADASASARTAMLSIVLPCYREAENLPVLHQRLQEVLTASGLDWEIVVIDDHSPDGTFEAAAAL